MEQNPVKNPMNFPIPLKHHQNKSRLIHDFGLANPIDRRFSQLETSIDHGFSMAMLVITRGLAAKWHLIQVEHHFGPRITRILDRFCCRSSPEWFNDISWGSYDVHVCFLLVFWGGFPWFSSRTFDFQIMKDMDLSACHDDKKWRFSGRGWLRGKNTQRWNHPKNQAPRHKAACVYR